MPNAPKTFRPHPTKRPPDRRRSASERGYDWTWHKLRNVHLSEYPLCQWCERKGRVVPGQIVDHIEPITGINDPKRLEASNLQTLCRACHASKTHRDNRGH